VQLLRITLIVFIFTFSSFTFSSNIVESVSNIPLKVFSAYPTFTPGQYIEYNQRLLALRQYDNQGLNKEFLVEMSGHSNHNSAFDAFLDTTENVVWIIDSHFDNAHNHYFTVDKYPFNENGFIGEPKKIILPANINGVIQGFNNNHMYIITEDNISGNGTYNFNEYDLSNEILLKRTLSFDDNFNSRISPSGDFFVTTNGIISLTEKEMIWTETDFGVSVSSAPFFIDDNTIMFSNWQGNYIGLINDKIISTSLILSKEPEDLGFEFDYSYFNSLSRTINYHSRDNKLIKSFSIDNINNSWQLSDINLSDIPLNSNNTIGDHYLRTLEGGLIYANSNFIYSDGVWEYRAELTKSFELDKGYVFVLNANDTSVDELYAISTGDVKELRKLKHVDNMGYQWHDIAELPKQQGEVRFSMLYQEKIYILYSPDIESYELSKAVIVNINGDHIETIDLPNVRQLDIKVSIYNGHFYLTSIWGNLKCTIETFQCDDLAPSLRISGSVQYFNNFLYAYGYMISDIDHDSNLFYYDTRNNKGWQKSLFEIPSISNIRFKKFGNNVRLNTSLLTFNENGEIDSLTPITAINDDSPYINNDHNVIEFKDGRVSCDYELVKCIDIKGKYLLKFTSNNSDSDERYSKIQGTPFFYDSVEQPHSLEVFKTKEDLLFPEINEVMPKEIEAWQNDQLSINFDNYFNNISYYEKGLLNEGWPDDEYLADDNGDFTIMLSNEHTWQEQTIQYGYRTTYTGINNYFTMPVSSMNIMLRDINDPPELREEISLTLTINKKDYTTVSFDDFLRDPERTELKYFITNLPLPSGLNPDYNGGLKGIKGKFSKAGIYSIDVLATDTSKDEMPSSFTFTIKVKDDSGKVPSTNDKPSSSGGSLGWGVLMLSMLFFSGKVLIRHK